MLHGTTKSFVVVPEALLDHASECLMMQALTASLIRPDIGVAAVAALLVHILDVVSSMGLDRDQCQRYTCRSNVPLDSLNASCDHADRIAS